MTKKEFKAFIELLATTTTLLLEDLKKGLHVTTHTGKMELIPSISTLVELNIRCMQRSMIKGSICAKCFAQNLINLRPTMRGCLARNTRLLTSEILPMELLPRTNTFYFRFESFGELNNAVQVINYFNICNKNPRTNFALWTKNLDMVKATLDMGYGKPSNLNIIYSSPMINKSIAGVVLDVFPWVDKVFTVYDKEFIKANNVHINCGSRNCFDCGLCYEKNDVREIREELK